MPNDDMNQFIAVLVRWCLIFAAILAVLLLLLTAALIWRPELVAEVLRFTLAAVCVVGAGYLIFCLLGAAFHRGSSAAEG